MTPKEMPNGDLEWSDIAKLSAGVNCGAISNFCAEQLDVDEGPENNNEINNDNGHDNETTQV